MSEHSDEVAPELREQLEIASAALRDLYIQLSDRGADHQRIVAVIDEVSRSAVAMFRQHGSPPRKNG